MLSIIVSLYSLSFLFLFCLIYLFFSGIQLRGKVMCYVHLGS